MIKTNNLDEFESLINNIFQQQIITEIEMKKQNMKPEMNNMQTMKIMINEEMQDVVLYENFIGYLSNYYCLNSEPTRYNNDDNFVIEEISLLDFTIDSKVGVEGYEIDGKEYLRLYHNESEFSLIPDIPFDQIIFFLIYKKVRSTQRGINKFRPLNNKFYETYEEALKETQ